MLLNMGTMFDYQKQFFTGNISQTIRILRYDIEALNVSGHLNT